MINLLYTCPDSGIMSVVYLVKVLLKLVFYILPVILIVMILIDFTKNVMAKGDDEMKKNNRLVVKRIIYCIMAFFVPAIVNVVINVVYNLTSEGESNGLACWDEASIANIKALREQEAEEQKRIENEKNQANQQQHQNNQANTQHGTGTPGLGGKKDDPSTTTPGGELPGGDGPSTVDNYTLYVGDSRTVGMCNIVKSKMGSNEECSAKEGMGYSWFMQTGLSTIKAKLSANPTANIVINMGTNDLGNVNKYIEKYKELTVSYPNAKIVAVSLTPVDDNKAKANGYKITNAGINSFNSSLKSGLSGSNVKYCDINSQITSPYGARDDGVHHSGDAYRQIYDLIKQCL